MVSPHILPSLPLQAEGHPEMLNKNWGMKGWTKGTVTLQQAFGINKGAVYFPKLTAQLPPAVGSSTSAKGHTPGGAAPLPKGGSPAQNAALGKKMVAAAGWTGIQWTDFNNIVMAESGWQTTVANSSSGAYGIPQALPGSKMASAGADWQTNPATQIKWMIGYIRSTYGTPANAWAFHLAHGWY